MAKANSDNIITRLYREFERAYAAQEQVYAAYERAPVGGYEAAEEYWSRSLGRCNQIAERIIRVPSQNRDEMLLKIRVAGWRAGLATSPAAVDRCRPTRRRHPGEEFHAYLALATLRDDIRRLGFAGTGKPHAVGAITSDKRVSRGQK